MIFRSLVSLTICIFVGSLFVSTVGAQEEDQYNQYLFLKGKPKYTPAKGAKGSQKLELIFDLSPDVPKGIKIEFELEYQGRALERSRGFYTLKDENRKNLKLVWTLKDKLGVDKYFLVTRMRPEEQKASVKKAILGKKDKFPQIDAPWSWLFFQKPIEIGTPEELAAEKEAICSLYDDLIGKLATNLKAFSTAMTEVKEGKKCVDGTQLNVEEFAQLIVDWRKKQGELQKSIKTLPLDQRAYVQKSRKAWNYLERLGKMVSKRSVALQKEVTDQYSAASINPASHPSFDRVFRYKVSEKTLNDTVGRILDLVCPEEPEEPERTAEE